MSNFHSLEVVVGRGGETQPQVSDYIFFLI